MAASPAGAGPTASSSRPVTAIPEEAMLQPADQVLYPVSDSRPTVLLEYVTVYRGDGAAQYLREFTRAVTRCRGCSDQERTWRVVGTARAGTRCCSA
jgi:hypothetical protein